LEETVSEVNRVVAEATGNTTPVIASQNQSPQLPDKAGRTPRVLLRLLVPTPFVEVYDPHESWPGSGQVWSHRRRRVSDIDVLGPGVRLPGG
jgi:hypothetical protein